MSDPLPSDIFQTGQILNNTYEIQGLLGRGGTGEVYRAVNQVTGRVFAIKALNAQFSVNADYQGLMRREEEMRSIVHDAVVRYNECSRTDGGHIYLVMDFISGLSLADMMNHRRLDAKELLIVAHRVAEGLVATHAQGIVHRDLSPDNIILRDGKAEAATIIDFGIAKDTAAGARTIVGNEFAGKYEYAAPEQLDGHSEARTDLYSLGATLLAAFRGETPYLGTTPGEIVRRKQSPLQTDGVPDPLKSLIDDLTAPDIALRPGSAGEVVDRIDGLLKSGKGRAPSRQKDTRKESRVPERTGRRRLWPVLTIVALASLVLAAVLLGLPQSIFGTSLPVASPYELNASRNEDGTARLFANAPDDSSAANLRDAFARATATDPETTEINLASGVPSDLWAEELADLIGLLTPLDRWAVQVEDLDASVTGVAADMDARAQSLRNLESWGTASSFGIVTDVLAGPIELPAKDITYALQNIGTCGNLLVEGPDVFALGDTVTIAGDLADDTDKNELRSLLLPLIGSRELHLRTETLNGDLCAIRAVLPPTPSANLSIRLSNGATGEANLTGAYRTGENPVVEVQAPADLRDVYLWVMLVDNTGLVFNILPNINNSEQRLSELGTVENGVRRVRVLHPKSSLTSDPSLLAVEVLEESYGKSEVIAILSSEPLFDIRRPRDESPASVASALAERLKGRDDVIIGIAARIIDAQP